MFAKLNALAAALGRLVHPMHKALAGFGGGAAAAALAEVTTSHGIDLSRLNPLQILGGAVVAALGVYAAPKNQPKA